MIGGILRSWKKFSLILVVPLLITIACSAPVKELRVRVPTRVQYDLSKYEKVCVFDFLVYEDFESFFRDLTVDYGHEIQQLIRNELQGAVETVVYDLRPAVFKESYVYKKERMQGETTSLKEGVPVPEIEFWSKDENARKWIEKYLVDDCLRGPQNDLEEKLSWFYGGRHPFTRRTLLRRDEFSGEEKRGAALVFGILEMKGVRGLLSGPGISARKIQKVPGSYQYNTYGTRIKYSVRIYLYDVEKREILYSNFQQTTITLPYYIEAMELAFFYAPMDRIMPKLLSPLVPVYIHTRRSLTRPSYTTKGAVP